MMLNKCLLTLTRSKASGDYIQWDNFDLCAMPSNRTTKCTTNLTSNSLDFGKLKTLKHLDLTQACKKAHWEFTTW